MTSSTDTDHQPAAILAGIRQAIIDAQDAKASWEFEARLADRSTNAAVVADCRRDQAYYEERYREARQTEAELRRLAARLGIEVTE